MDESASGTPWEVVLGFAALWTVCVGIPYVVLSAHPFSSRYGYYSAFGVALLLVALPHAFVTAKPKLAIGLQFVLALFALWCIAGKLAATKETYAPVEAATGALTSELAKRKYPKDSQIIVACRHTEVLRTASVWPWSTGFLRYYLHRDDVSGLIGSPRSFYNPFVAWHEDWQDKMAGLVADKPLFVYACDETAIKLEPKNYLLQWSDSNGGNVWTIHSLDRESGKVSPYASGSGKAQFTDQVRAMEAKGIHRVEIYGAE